MSLISLPLLTESTVAAYLIANKTSEGYRVFRSFSVDDYSLPAILVTAGKFTEEVPTGNIFRGELAITVLTKIDENEDPLATHDFAISEVYDLMLSDELTEAFNAAGHLWGMFIESYDQSKDGRAFVSTLTYSIQAQNLAI